MARLIPPHIHRETPSGERLLFERFRDDPHTADWTVLHSLYLSQHGHRPYGEVDFIVFIPNQGIFCLEVKSGLVHQREGVWTTTGNDGQTAILKRSPFAQTRDAMFAVRERLLREKIPGSDLQPVAFGSAVVLPHTPFDARSEEWEPWEVIDRKALEQLVSIPLLKLAREQRRRLNTPPALPEPSLATIRRLVQVLRPDFETVLSRGASIAESERALLRLTEEQYDFLFNLAAHPRWICEGAAGTGKTMLALEFALRLASTTDERVLLLCYNSLLGNWLENEIAARNLSSRVRAGSFHRMLGEVIGKSTFGPKLAQAKIDAPTDLYSHVYSELGWQAITEIGEQFDAVIVDETQDLVRPEFLETLDVWLCGGLAKARSVFFGDFHRQAIFSDLPAVEQRALLQSKLPGSAPWLLRRNCRNTRVIAEETALLSGFEALPYRLASEAGVPVDYSRYRDETHAADLIATKLAKLLQDGVRAADIVVLSPHVLEKSAVRHLLNGTVPFRIVEAGAPTTGISRKPLIRFATIHAFKGMESSVIVLCDIETLGDGEPQALVYVAMSRARCQLTVLRHERTQTAYMKCLERSLSETWKNSA